MRSKIKSFFLFNFIVMILFVSGCSYFLDKKEKSEEISYNKSVGGCIKRVNTTLSHFFQTEELQDIANSEIDAMIACYQESILSFMKYTKSGRSASDNYSADNIDMLFKRFHPEVEVGPERLQSYIELKYFLIGGEPETVSKSELKVIHDLMPVIGDLMKNINEERAILFNKAHLRRTKGDYSRFENVHQDLSKGVLQLVQKLRSYSGNRSINLPITVPFLLSEILGQDGQNMIKHLELFISFKNLTLNQSGEELNRNDLDDFVKQALVTYSSLSKFNYFLQDNHMFRNIGTVLSYVTAVPDMLKDSSVFKTIALRALYDVIEGGELVLRRAIERHPESKIDFNKVSNVISSLETSGILAGELTASTLSYFIEQFSSRWLSPGQGKSPDFNMTKVSYIKTVVNKWFERQQIINTLFESPDTSSVSFSSLETSLKEKQLFKNWRDHFVKTALHQWNEKNKVIYSEDLSEFTYEELTVSNSITILIDLFIKPYNLEKDKVSSYYLTTNEAQKIYEVLRILGVEMAFMDSRIYNSGHRAFRESNNFSTQLRNDTKMDFYEIYEYLSVALTSGAFSDRIYDRIEDHCYLDYKDVHFKNVIKTNCFREYFRRNFGVFFNHLRTVNAYWRQASGEDQEDFLTTLETAARGGVISEKPYDLVEIRTSVSVLYYLESIFYTFDKDRNGIAEGDELNRAEAHFRNLIVEFILENKKDLLERVKNVAGMVSKDWTQRQVAEFLAPKIFIHLLREGILPEGLGGSTWKFMKLLTERSEKKAYEITQADAHDVLKVFSALAILTHQSLVAQIEQFLATEQNRDALTANLVTAEMPDCRTYPHQMFCKWASLIACNETVKKDLYKWMKENKYALFPEDDYMNKHDEALASTMEQLDFTFRSHQKFSTQCSFPQVITDEPKSDYELPEEKAEKDKGFWGGVKGLFGND